MKYLQFVFENEEVCNLTDTNQELINEATANIIYNSINLESYVKENLDQFVSSNSSLADIYEAIRDFAVQETIDLFHASSEVIKDPLLNNELKSAILEGEEATQSRLEQLETKAGELKEQAKAAGKAGIGAAKSVGHNALIAVDQGVKAAINKGSELSARGGIAIMRRLNDAKDGIEAAIQAHPTAAVSALAAAVAGVGSAGYYGLKKYKASHKAV